MSPAGRVGLCDCQPAPLSLRQPAIQSGLHHLRLAEADPQPGIRDQALREPSSPRPYASTSPRRSVAAAGTAAPHSMTVTLASDQRVESRTRMILDQPSDCEWSAEPLEGTAAIAFAELDSMTGRADRSATRWPHCARSWPTEVELQIQRPPLALTH